MKHAILRTIPAVGASLSLIFAATLASTDRESPSDFVEAKAQTTISVSNTAWRTGHVSSALGISFTKSDLGDSISYGSALFVGRRAWAHFSTSSIPNNACIEKVEIVIDPYNYGTAYQTAFAKLVIEPTSSSDAQTLYNALGSGTTYATVDEPRGNEQAFWTDLGPSARSDFTAAVTGVDKFFVAIRGEGGLIYALARSANKPQLRVTYSVPPGTPVAPTMAPNPAQYGQLVTVTWPEPSGAPTSYQLQKDGATIYTGTERAYSFIAGEDDSGNYRVRASNSCSSATGPVRVFVSGAPVNVDAVRIHLLGGEQLSSEDQQVIDSVGNRSGMLDLGDFRILLNVTTQSAPTDAAGSGRSNDRIGG